jgi:hypothetical protein
VHTGLSWGNLRERDRLENLGIDGRTILKWILRSGIGGLGQEGSGSDRGRWRALVNAVMYFRLP